MVMRVRKCHDRFLGRNHRSLFWSSRTLPDWRTSYIILWCHHWICGVVCKTPLGCHPQLLAQAKCLLCFSPFCRLFAQVSSTCSRKFMHRPGTRLLRSFLMILGLAGVPQEGQPPSNSRYHSLREAESVGYWEKNQCEACFQMGVPRWLHVASLWAWWQLRTCIDLGILVFSSTCMLRRWHLPQWHQPWSDTLVEAQLRRILEQQQVNSSPTYGGVGIHSISVWTGQIWSQVVSSCCDWCNSLSAQYSPQMHRSRCFPQLTQQTPSRLKVVQPNARAMLQLL